MSETSNSGTGETIQIEAIMESIRGQLAEGEPPGQNTGPLPAAFYEHLEQARLAYDRIEVQAQLTTSNVPIVGPLLQKLRRKLHEVILFYVNQLAANQMQVNAHLLQALTILSQEVEKNDGDRA